jgi:antitoxin component of MazEF toxin-antitoxin module
MSVVRAPSTNEKAMIRIVNNLLTRAGFSIGTAIEVSYQPGIITIKKVNKHHGRNKLQK